MKDHEWLISFLGECGHRVRGLDVRSPQL
jgi:hypothetical protein